MKQKNIYGIALLSTCINMLLQAANCEDATQELCQVSRAFAHVYKKIIVKKQKIQKSAQEIVPELGQIPIIAWLWNNQTTSNTRIRYWNMSLRKLPKPRGYKYQYVHK